jgi:hypothetical protein
MEPAGVEPVAATGAIGRLSRYSPKSCDKHDRGTVTPTVTRLPAADQSPWVGYDRGFDPLDKPIENETPRSQPEHDVHRLSLSCLDLVTVEDEEHVHGYECRPLVPIQKCMVPRQAESVLGREPGQTRIWSIAPHVARPGQGRLQQSLIPQPHPSAVFTNLVGVDRLDDHTVQPDRLVHGAYFDSSRRAFRYLPAVR